MLDSIINICIDSPAYICKSIESARDTESRLQNWLLS